MYFSVLMSLYEKEDPNNLRLALESLQHQTLQAADVVIVVDGYIAEDLEKVIKEFASLLPIQIVILPTNVGLGRALNEGLRYCKYDLVARMDTDDICYFDRFEKQISFLHHNPDVSILGATVQEFNKIPGDLKRFRKLPVKMEEILKFARYRSPLNHPSVVFRKSHIENAGSYQDMLSFEDYFLWLRMLQKGYKIENLPESLVHFRIGNDMIGRRKGLSYLKNEYCFLKAARELGFLSNFEIFSGLLMKLPLRLLPARALEYIYRRFLR